MKPGLILVDIQNDYFPGGRMELVGIDQASAHARSLLSAFRDRGLPLFHIQHVFLTPDAPFFSPGTEGVKINERVAPLASEIVIEKHFPNSFRESSLLEQIKKAGVDSLVICGAMSHMCIDATTRHAADLGFSCSVVHDACATRDVEFAGSTVRAADVHASFMSALGWAYARLTSTRDFLSDFAK
jgi:nicotinamidase-related amidase